MQKIQELRKLQETLDFRVGNWGFLYGYVCWVMRRLNLKWIRFLWEDDWVIRKIRFAGKFSVAQKNGLKKVNNKKKRMEDVRDDV